MKLREFKTGDDCQLWLIDLAAKKMARDTGMRYDDAYKVVYCQWRPNPPHHKRPKPRILVPPQPKAGARLIVQPMPARGLTPAIRAALAKAGNIDLT